MFLGALLLYNFRILERHWGTWKFSSISFLCATLGTFLNVLYLAIAKNSVSRLSLGPVSLIFSLAVFYASEVPPSYHIQALGLQLSDHLFFYFLAFQVSTCLDTRLIL